MRTLLLIGSGSFIGGILRYLTSQFIYNKSALTFPFGTLGVNIIGCFFIGILFGMTEKASISFEARLFLATGICGGFTTFSAFSQETFSLLREGQFTYAVIYIVLSVVIGLLATFSGIMALKLFQV
ncbi:MAG: fluoride efflux transporter CrcB [Bacteroidia bacterium]|nr:fluoride efflux transporter CrcB [Bacteroidia bacterium]